jgi:fructan beta-fructosidase
VIAERLKLAVANDCNRRMALHLISQFTVTAPFMLYLPKANAAQNVIDTPQYRPAFHFSPQRNWMNDPNGLVYDNGVYHLFFQYHPDGLTWGPMHWGHATSHDLVHWKELPIALFPDALGMIFSGSIVIDTDNTSGLGHDGEAPWVALFTHHDMAGEKAGTGRYQHQSVAVSLDKGQSWQKYTGNPVIPNPGIKNFRDPKVFWHAETGRWIMVLAGGDRILFYASANLIDWSATSELTSFDVAEGNVLECPDLIRFELNGKARWVLLVSVYTGGPNGGSGTHYVVGDFDGYRFVPEQDDIRWLDYGPDNYAGVTFHNAPGKPLLIGWMSNWVYAQTVPTAPWRSAMTLPRELLLVEVEGEAFLQQRVAPKLGSSVRADARRFALPDGVGILKLNGANGESFKLHFSNDTGDQLAIGYDPSKTEYYIDRFVAGGSGFSELFPMRATAPAKGKGGDAEIYLDRSSVELFADDGLTVMTSLVFPRAPFTAVALVTDSPQLWLNFIERFADNPD